MRDHVAGTHTRTHDTPDTRRRDLRRARLAVEIAVSIETAVQEGRPADRSLAERFRGHREYGSRDRRFYGEAVFAALRWRGWAGSVSERGGAAAVVAHWLDRVHPDPAWVALARALDLPLSDGAGWGGLTLEQRAAALAATGMTDTAPETADLVPDWTIPALAPELDHDLPRILAAFQERPALWLRASGLEGPALCERLTARGLTARCHPRLPSAVALEEYPHLQQLASEIGPCFQVQDLSAQAVAACAAPEPGEQWWDACAGSGGKTFPLAERIGPGGRVLATDRRGKILREMTRRQRTLSALRAGIDLDVRDASRPPTGLVFDGVLLDAPCSGLGTWSRNPDARWRTEATAPAEHARRQARLIRAAAGAVRPGGRLVYAVCTLTAVETVDLVEGFLRDRTDFAPNPVPAPLGGAPAARHWIHPWSGPCSGMFIAVLRRGSDARATRWS